MTRRCPKSEDTEGASERDRKTLMTGVNSVDNSGGRERKTKEKRWGDVDVKGSSRITR